MSDRRASIVFASLLCLVCSLVLTAASTGLQRFQEQNARIDKHRNLLQAAGLLDPAQRYGREKIETLYTASIRAVWVDPDGRVVDASEREESDFPLYIHEKDGRIAGYIVPIRSRGLWGRIHGYLALENDGSTVAGFTVYKHSETPGLGGEIEKNWFQQNWVGKQIVDRDGEFVSISIAKGAVTDSVPEERHPHYVDGISGATLTGKYLTAGLRQVLASYEPVSIRFRNDRFRVPPAD